MHHAAPHCGIFQNLEIGVGHGDAGNARVDVFVLGAAGQQSQPNSQRRTFNWLIFFHRVKSQVCRGKNTFSSNSSNIKGEENARPD